MSAGAVVVVSVVSSAFVVVVTVVASVEVSVVVVVTVVASAFWSANSTSVPIK